MIKVRSIQFCRGCWYAEATCDGIETIGIGATNQEAMGEAIDHIRRLTRKHRLVLVSNVQ